MKGLQGISMLDNTQNMAKVAPMDQALRIDGEFDRIFVETPSQLQVCFLEAVAPLATACGL